MKKIIFFLILFFPAFVSAGSTLNLGYNWSLKNVTNNNYSGSDLYYKGNFIRHFSTCEEQANVCNTSTSGLKAGKSGVFIEYYSGGGMDPGIYLIKPSGYFVGQNTDVGNICLQFQDRDCKYQGFSLFGTKIKLHYILDGTPRSKLISVKI